jgi:hypothetical protein
VIGGIAEALQRERRNHPRPNDYPESFGSSRNDEHGLSGEGGNDCLIDCSRAAQLFDCGEGPGSEHDAFAAGPSQASDTCESFVSQCTFTP